MLKASDLTCVRNGRKVFQNVNVSLQAGEVLHVQGENGVGKSSLLRVLCGLLEPESGIISWNNQPIQEDYRSYFANLAYLGHKCGLKSTLTVAENLQIFSGASEKTIMMQGLEQLGIAHLLNARVEILSAGQQQRVAWLRCVIKKANLWLLDEPFNAMDQASISTVTSWMSQHIQQDGMIIFTSHQDIPLHEIKMQTLRLI